MDMGNILLYSATYFGIFTATLFFLSFFEHKSKLKNPQVARYPTVSVAVPAYNEQETLAKTVQSLLDLDYPQDKIEIFVVDDGSTDNTFEVAKQFEKQGVLVITKENTGKADSLNVVLAQAKGELFGALDADSFVEPSTLKKMIGYFDDKTIMAVTPSLKVATPKTFLQRIQQTEYLVGVYLRKVFAYFGSIHVTPGPFTIYRKAFFIKHGGYDKGNLTEDIEVALRIQKHHYHIENAIDASVYTVCPQHFKALLLQRKRWYLGFINNVLVYKSLFSHKYGNLGLFVLPGSFLSVFFAITLFFYGLFKLSESGLSVLKNLLASNFEVLPLLNFRLDFFFLNLSPLFIFSMLSLAIGLIAIYLAKRHSQERSAIKLSYVLYILFYWIIFAYWWMAAGWCKVTRSNVRWKK
jgi:cellulose synthase/poly-beta-1,6-N-acetylglucosamine synthase-like glycosyltransferase